MSIRRVSVRFNKHESAVRGSEVWEMRCDSCASAGQTKAWWEIDSEFWDPRSGLQRCRACNATRKRMAHRQTVEERRAKQRAYYYENHATRLAWRKAYHAANHERINAERRAKYLARKVAAIDGLWEING